MDMRVANSALFSWTERHTSWTNPTIQEQRWSNIKVCVFVFLCVCACVCESVCVSYIYVTTQTHTQVPNLLLSECPILLLQEYLHKKDENPLLVLCVLPLTSFAPRNAASVRRASRWDKLSSLLLTPVIALWILHLINRLGCSTHL